jgi:hypothetical protein
MGGPHPSSPSSGRLRVGLAPESEPRALPSPRARTPRQLPPAFIKVTNPSRAAPACPNPRP